MKMFDAVSRDDVHKIVTASMPVRSVLASEWRNLDEADKKRVIDLINRIDDLMVEIGKAYNHYR